MERLRHTVLPSGPVLPIYEDAGEGSSSSRPHRSSTVETVDQASSEACGNPESVQLADDEAGIPLAEIPPPFINPEDACCASGHLTTARSNDTPPVTPSVQAPPGHERQSVSNHETSSPQKCMDSPAATTAAGDDTLQETVRNRSAAERAYQTAAVESTPRQRPFTEIAAIATPAISRVPAASAVVISTPTEPAQEAPEPTTVDPLTAEPTETRQEAEQGSSIFPAGGRTTTTHDVGATRKRPPEGYPRLAKRMACMPAASIFRSFAALNIQNLLHMQAELECLENELLEVQGEDAGVEENETTRRWKYTRNWWTLQRSESSEQGANEHDDPCQRHIAQKIQEKLQKYNEALIQLMTILSANKPGIHDFNDIRNYIESEEMLHGRALIGDDSFIYRSDPKDDRMPLKDDLITLRPRAETDRLTRWVISWVLRILHKNKENARRQQGPDVAFVDDDIYRWTFVLTSGLAAMLPVASMLALQTIEGVPVRKLSLVLIAVFNFVLAFLLTWLTSVRRAEVFAIASAFAAVNVVFIGK